MTTWEPRPWTPYEETETGGTRLSVKRACNGCGTLLGDVTDIEMNAAVRGQELRGVEHECGLCRGFHVLHADPVRRPFGWRPEHGDTWTIKVLCPGVPDGQPVLPCATWQQCGCVPPGTDPLTVEYQAFLEQPCPDSPTGEHRYLEVDGVTAAPTGGCWYQEVDVTDAADGLTTRPGMWPVNVGCEEETPYFQLADLSRRDVAPEVA